MLYVPEIDDREFKHDDCAPLQVLLQSWNERVNLTRLVNGNDFWIGQVFDSLWPLAGELQSANEPQHWIDVGTGGGFPGLAVAIAVPQSQVTLLDSVGRKTAAVEAMANSLGLADRVRVRTERIETTGRDRNFRGSFDRAVARAVAAAPVVAEYLVPLLKTDGQALLYRGQWNDSDAVPFNRALHLLQARLPRLLRVLPLLLGAPRRGARLLLLPARDARRVAGALGHYKRWQTTECSAGLQGWAAGCRCGG